MRRRFMINKAMKLENYLTFVCLSDGSSISFSNDVEYCIGNSIWKTLYVGIKIENIMKGTTVSFRLNNPIIDATYGVGVFSTEGSFDLMGNIMSMLFYDEAVGHIDLTGFKDAFSNMFKNNNSLVDCSKLNLPATTLSDFCYFSMFSGCTSLVKAPELPATTLAISCYNSMFSGCTSLVKAPELPATTLAIDCYNSMFDGCTSLVNAPELPATTLKRFCYTYMFRDCINLNYIKMLATDISATNCLNYWVEGVSPTGTFVKSKDATWNVVGISGVPTGWTVITDEFGGLITFYIDIDVIRYEFHAQDGMTWYDFVDSGLNPKNVVGVKSFEASEFSVIYDNGNRYLIKYNDEYFGGNLKIEDGMVFGAVFTGSGGAG